MRLLKYGHSNRHTLATADCLLKCVSSRLHTVKPPMDSLTHVSSRQVHRTTRAMAITKPAPHFYNTNNSNGNGNWNGNGGTNGKNDLFMFLDEIGPTPKEARYWLKEFNRSSKHLSRPFGAMQVNREVLLDEKLRNDLFESISFIHRNGMKCVLIHGSELQADHCVTVEDLKILRSVLSQDSQVLVSGMEAHNTPVRLLYAGSEVLQAKQDIGYNGNISGIDTDLIQQALDSGHIPIIQGLGMTPSGQMLALDINHVTSYVSQVLTPLKVMIVNTTGGFTNQYDEVIANINIPADIEVLDSMEWFSDDNRQRVQHVASLLNVLPRETSVVLTSASKILTELFSHHGAGTFFKIPETIASYTSMEQIDQDRLQKLINESFAKDLDEGYFDDIINRIDRIYLSEDYNAAAIITKEEGLDIPYLDKFAVTVTQQGQGQGEMLWNAIKKDYKRLFWRSKFDNKINNWYFQKSSSFIRQSSGSWSNGAWMVFWFGVEDHQESSKIVDFCLGKPSTFTISS